MELKEHFELGKIPIFEWIECTDRLPPHTEVVLGWGKHWDSDIIGFYLCGVDYKNGWLNWPNLDNLEISYWAFISGPNHEKEWLYAKS